MLENPAFWAFVRELVIQVAVTLTPVLIGYAIFLAKRGADYLAEKIGDRRYEDLMKAVRVLVLAAEQSGFKDTLLATGEAKKQWVIHRVQEYADMRGWPVNVAEISDMIEAIVYDELSRSKVVPRQDE